MIDRRRGQAARQGLSARYGVLETSCGTVLWLDAAGVAGKGYSSTRLVEGISDRGASPEDATPGRQ